MFQNFCFPESWNQLHFWSYPKWFGCCACACGCVCVCVCMCVRVCINTVLLASQVCYTFALTSYHSKLKKLLFSCPLPSKSLLVQRCVEIFKSLTLVAVKYTHHQTGHLKAAVVLWHLLHQLEEILKFCWVTLICMNFALCLVYHYPLYFELWPIGPEGGCCGYSCWQFCWDDNVILWKISCIVEKK